ncbi:conserved hypothetical protein [Uncinocarpus reesii 1704]|uniref:RING-CH-type domain-containing protein n=1 Tax=Uncinocarpus reesii (strain UAMH 1704) TaxID=336963 RepID=C4JXA9_UNCRE|nr:uncharacterized protein UREG_06282 [Uncinocarpus reesii 1704]EEP81417.1 conserved hypothetical protein [Uncinocarpus reesii 1704]
MELPGQQRNAPSWHWPEDPAAHPAAASPSTEQQGNPTEPADPSGEPPRTSRTYPSKTCRICLETVPPTYHPMSENLPSFLQSGPRVTYESEDPSLGRLIRPCKCKGSSRYVHEGCLSKWRHADPRYGQRNFWQCPTCGFQYKLQRVAWGRLISGSSMQILLTILVLLSVMFVLGFVADPIINLYVDPYETIASGTFWEEGDEPIPLVKKAATWPEHFVKGLASLGVLSFLKVIFAVSPWHWWNLRNSGLVGGGRRPGATGRNRVSSVSWIVIVIGVATFLLGVYKGVRAWSCRILEKAGQRVMDVPLDDDEDADISDDPSKKED